MARKRHAGQQLDAATITCADRGDRRASWMRGRLEVLLAERGLRWSKLKDYQDIKHLPIAERPAFYVGPRCPEGHSGCGLHGAVRYATTHLCLECVIGRARQNSPAGTNMKGPEPVEAKVKPTPRVRELTVEVTKPIESFYGNRGRWCR